MSEAITHVLLVSGDGLERTTLGEYLRGCGFHVIEAIDGDEAAIALETKSIDIVVTDVQLRHHGSGHSISAFAKKQDPSIEVILVSNVEQAVKTAVDLCEEGPAEVLPYHPEKLMRRIQELRGR